MEIDQLLTEWIGIVSNNTGEKDYARTIKLMQERGLLGQGEKETEQSLRMLLEMSVSRFLKAKPLSLFWSSAQQALPRHRFFLEVGGAAREVYKHGAANSAHAPSHSTVHLSPQSASSGGLRHSRAKRAADSPSPAAGIGHIVRPETLPSILLQLDSRLYCTGYRGGGREGFCSPDSRPLFAHAA